MKYTIIIDSLIRTKFNVDFTKRKITAIKNKLSKRDDVIAINVFEEETSK